MEYGTYFCGTYGTYGKNNKTGCRCHRVKHSLIEALVDKYLTETGQELGELVGCSADVFNDAWDKWAESISKQNQLWSKMNATAAAPTTLQSVFNIVERYSPDACPEIQAAIEAKEAELDDMLAGFVRLTPIMQDRANRKMEALSSEIEQLKTQIEDLSVPYAEVSAELEARTAALNYAASLGEQTGPQRAEALAKVVDKIVCHFRYVGIKSILDAIEIHSVDASCFTVGVSPGPS